MSVLILVLVQVWFATEAGNLEVTYTHNEEHVGYCHSVLFIKGMMVGNADIFLS